jgi:Zn-dependent protease/predicted transcriptional regulator
MQISSGGARIGRILGIPIYLHPSWFLVFALITYSLVRGYHTEQPSWNEPQQWLVALATSLLFFASVVFHELAHSVVAQRFKIPVISITLFVFGGVARIGREAESGKQEFLIAAAGPASSYFLAGTLYLLSLRYPETTIAGVMAVWLLEINFALATFNLIPGFPLDGGRILRSIVWGMTGNFSRATKIASRAGQFFAYGFILLGIWQAFTESPLSGLWLAFIGWFLRTAAGETYAQVAVRDQLNGLRVSDVMSTDLAVIPRSVTLEDYLQEVLRTGRRCHLVTGDNDCVGLITVHALNSVAREDWAGTSVQAVMLPRPKIHCAAPDEPLLRILERMNAEDISQMPVVSSDSIVGMVTRDSVLKFLQTRLELAGVAGSSRSPV